MEPVPHTLPSKASAVCRDVSFDESGRPIYEAAQQLLTWSKEQQPALGGAGDRGAVPRLARRDDPCSDGAAVSNRVER